MINESALISVPYRRAEILELYNKIALVNLILHRPFGPNVYPKVSLLAAQ